MPMDLTEGPGIVLSSTVLKHLQDLSPAALCAYIFLASRNSGKLRGAGISEISVATGRGLRTAGTALRSLLELDLIFCEADDSYCIFLPASVAPVGASLPNGTAGVSSQNCITAGPPAPAHPPKCEDERTPATTPAPAAPTIDRRTLDSELIRLIVQVYRPVNADELAELKSYIPDADVLKGKLCALKCAGGGVAPDMSIWFLGRALIQFQDLILAKH